MNTLPQPLLIFAWGNPSRGDDAIGPVIYERLLERGPDNADILTDFQLQVEHAVDLVDRQRVLFIDAATEQHAPILLHRLDPERDISYTTHALSPQSLLGVYDQVYGEAAPPAYLLTVAGYRFGLGEELSAGAQQNVEVAISLITQLASAIDSDWLALSRGSVASEGVSDLRQTAG